jgi:hypothetical protein
MDGRTLEQRDFGWNRHREERSDAAIQESWGALRSLDCFELTLAMTILVGSDCIVL